MVNPTIENLRGSSSFFDALKMCLFCSMINSALILYYTNLFSSGVNSRLKVGVYSISLFINI